MGRRIRRWGGRRKEKRIEREIRQLRELIEASPQRLGYRASAADSISRLHLGTETCWFLLQLGYTISELEISILTGQGFFRARGEWDRSEFVEGVVRKVVAALIEYRGTNLRLLKEVRRRLAKD